MTKTVGILINEQHIIPHGGVGQFCRALSKIIKDLGHQVVLITDKKTNKPFLEEITSLVIYPDNSLSYQEHRKLYGRFQEGVCHEKIANFNTALNKASILFDFDVIIANSHETLAALADFETNAKKIMYTHLYKQVYPNCKFRDVFTPDYHEFFQQFLHRPDIIVGTQTEHNRDLLLAQGITNIDVLPMPISEPSLLESSEHLAKRGALYIGRWEAGKNPKDYLKLVSEHDLYPKVLTNKTGAKKFEEAFQSLGIKDYEIKYGIIGEEKVDFIKGCKVFLNTSLIECFPNSVMETIGHMPVVTLSKVKVPWQKNFNDHLHIINMRKNSETTMLLIDIYNDTDQNCKPQLEFINEYDKMARFSWKAVIER